MAIRRLRPQYGLPTPRSVARQPAQPLAWAAFTLWDRRRTLPVWVTAVAAAKRRRTSSVTEWPFNSPDPYSSYSRLRPFLVARKQNIVGISSDAARAILRYHSRHHPSVCRKRARHQSQRPQLLNFQPVAYDAPTRRARIRASEIHAARRQFLHRIRHPILKSSSPRITSRQVRLLAKVSILGSQPPEFSSDTGQDQPVKSVSPAAQIQRHYRSAAAVQQRLQRGA